MKTLASLGNGVVTVTEDQGVVSLNINASASVGGGEAAGVLKAQGQASVQLDTELGLKLGEAVLNAHLPTAVAPLAVAVEAVVAQALKSLE